MKLREKWLNSVKLLLIASLALSELSLGYLQTLPQANAFIPGATCVVDQQGDDDIAEPDDINQFCHTASFDISNGNTSGFYLTWDDSTFGNQPGPLGCVLIDNESGTPNGLADFAVCGTRLGDSVLQQASVTVYTCDDTSALSCGSATVAPFGLVSSCTMVSGDSSADPFSGSDTSLRCALVNSEFGINVSRTAYDGCSYEGALPNSDPVDCIVATPNMATVTVSKALEPASDDGLFDLRVNGVQYATDVSNGGSTTVVPVSSTSDVEVLEEAGTNTTLTDYETTVTCVNQDGTTVASGTRTGALTRQITIQDGDINDGDAISCVFTNSRIGGTLVVNKVLNQNYGGTETASDFSFIIDGAASPGPIDFEADGSNEVFLPVGNYSISEVSVDGYEPAYDGCIEFEIVANATHSCTITNSDLPGTVNIEKTVINDNGGTATADSFSFEIDGNGIPGTVFAFTGINTISGSIEVDAGDYAVTEVENPEYDVSYGDGCSGTIVNGQTVDCVITNDDKPATLIIEKTLINDNGGTLGLSDFSVYLNDDDAPADQISFAADNNQIVLELAAGDYTVTEVPVSGYDVTYENCTSLSIGLGQTATCTITNDDQAGTLTVTKELTADNGNSSVLSDFGFVISDSQGNSQTHEFDNSGEVELTLDAETYTVEEIYADDSEFTITYDGCENIILGNGDDLECIITNDDNPIQLTLNIVITNDNGGSAVASDFSVELNGAEVHSFIGSGPSDTLLIDSIIPGDLSVVIAETDLNDYYGISFSETCEFEELTNGDELVCTIIADDIAPALAVLKSANLDNYADQDFEFTIENNDTIYDEFTLNPDSNYIYEADQDLSAGTISITEAAMEGWYEYSSYCIGVDVTETDIFISDPAELDIELGGRYACIFYNFEYSEVELTKYHDYNENGIRDEGEPGLEGWQLTLDHCSEEVFFDVAYDMNTYAHDNYYSINCQNQGVEGVSYGFSDTDGRVNLSQVEVGLYEVGEIEQATWRQSAVTCELDEYDQARLQSLGSIMAVFDHNDADEYFSLGDEHIFVLPGEKINCDIGNHHDPIVDIIKTNDTNGPVQPGDEVTFTLKITVPGVDESGHLYDPVTVVDNLTDQFEYIPGSFTAMSSERGDLVAAGVTTDPNYASPGTWNLTSAASNVVVPGELITLTYRAVVGQGTNAATYNTDVTVTGATVASSQLVSDTDGDSVIVEVPQVLGATTGSANPAAVLSATGQEAILTVSVGVVIVGGALFTVLRRSKKD